MTGLEPAPYPWVEKQRTAEVVYDDEVVDAIFWAANPDVEVQIVTRKTRCSATHELIDIAVMLQVRDFGSDAWGDDAYRCDSRRGYVHEHFGPPLVNPPEDHVVLHVPPRCASNLHSAFEWALARAYKYVEQV